MNDKKIIAVDFDGTLFETSPSYPQVGKPKTDIINKCKELQEKYTLVLWTCRQGNDLDIALKTLENVGLRFEYANKNPQWAIDLWGNDCRKIGATWYIDDKNITFENFLKL